MARFTTMFLFSALISSAIACGDEGAELVDVETLDADSESIINGYVAGSGFIVRQGALYLGTGGGYTFICGASYVGQSGGQHWVLTAAHCVENTGGDYLVAFGKGTRSTYTFDDVVFVESVSIAPGYRFGQVSPNDIAVLRVSGAPNATTSIMASTSTDASPGDLAYISGFGRTQTGTVSDVLLYADTRVISTSECQSFFSDVDGSQICILDDIGVAQNACNGDSGGPMYLPNAVQVGLTSFGLVGCPTSAPAVYTRISAFRSWINSVSGL